MTTDDAERRVLDALAAGPLGLGEIALASGLAVPEAADVLLALKMAGRVRRLPGAIYEPAGPPDADTLARVREALGLARGPADDRLAWLSSLLADLVAHDWAWRRDDPDGAAEALLECRRLLEGLEAAFAHERRPRPEDEVPGAPDPGEDVLPY